MNLKLLLPVLTLVLLHPNTVTSYAPGGKCGKQFGGNFCDVDQGCCSYSGYCGTTADYCLVANGCQSNCTDGSATASVPPAIIPAATTSTPSSTSPISSASSTAEASASSPVTKNVIIGIIVAAVGLILLGGVGLFLYKKSKTKSLERIQERCNGHELKLAEARRSEQMLSIVERHGPRAIQGIPRLQLTDGDRELTRSPPYGRVVGDLD